MEKSNPIRILYAGDSWMTAGTLGAFSSFTYDLRGAAVEYQAQGVIDSWRSASGFEVEYMAAWDTLAHFPEALEAIERFNVIFLSDIESDAIVLYPPERCVQAPMGPNRLKLLREFVSRGGALAMIGGYASFTGRHNAGNYRGTPVEEVLPVNCLGWMDDRQETPEGVSPSIEIPSHPVVRGLPWDECPVFNGYNRVQVKPGAEILATFKETGDPMLAVWEYGSGRTLAFTSDVAPHWGARFQQWSGCGRFMEQLVQWLAHREVV
jgi:uncharacterized membrane protein